MGGKTQQRVAGNVKPSSSGRIRDLLINKHGTGNIITFSALAANNTSPRVVEKPSPSGADQGSKEVKKDIEPPRDDSPPSIDDAQTAQNSNPVHSPTKTALVLKKVGNRDFYTKVQLSPDQDLPDQTEIKKTGIFKPSYEETLELNTDLEKEYLAQELARNTDGDTKSSDPNQAIEDQLNDETEGETYDFDEIIDQLTQIREATSHPGASSIDDLISDDVIAVNVELIRILGILVDKFSKEMSIEEWDIVISLIYSWSSAISKSDAGILLNKTKVNFCCNFFNFVNRLIILAKVWRTLPTVAVDDDFPMLPSLLNDWANFHTSQVYQDLVILYLKIVDSNGLPGLDEEDKAKLLEALSNIVIDVDAKLLIANKDLFHHFRGDDVNIDAEIKLPEKSVYIDVNDNQLVGFKAMCDLLTSNHRVVVVTAHSMLSKNIKAICDSAKISTLLNLDEEEIDDLFFLPPSKLMSILTSRDTIISVLLSDYQAGDISVTIDPKSESYACTLTYLFAWDLTIQFIVGMDKEVGHRMIHCLKRLGLLQRLLDTIFMLLPPLGVRDSLNLRFETEGGSKKVLKDSWTLSDFLKSPLVSTVQRPINEIELIALHIFFSVACHMPVTVRKWYNNNSNKRLCKLVNEYTVKHISSLICALEMDTVQEKCQERADDDKMNNLVIKARPNAREVYAIYTRDEFRMELTIKLPVNYPLDSVQIDGGKRVGVTDVKWRSWLLQLTTFLSHQNGPILDGIDLWRRNIDKRFEGLEKCMICFSILHSNYQLPKKKCQSCTKMFHNHCLYKWFESSGNSTCPLCRSIW